MVYTVYCYIRWDIPCGTIQHHRHYAQPRPAIRWKIKTELLNSNSKKIEKLQPYTNWTCSYIYSFFIDTWIHARHVCMRSPWMSSDTIYRTFGKKACRDIDAEKKVYKICVTLSWFMAWTTHPEIMRNSPRTCYSSYSYKYGIKS